MVTLLDQVILSYVLEALEGITIQNGYDIDVKTVTVADRTTRDLNNSECPAILISTGNDRIDLTGPHPDGQTFGGQSGNAFYRLWNLGLLLRLPDTDARGSLFKWNVIRCLQVNRCEPAGKLPWDILIESLDTDEFERIENSAAQYRLNILVKYAYTLTDLGVA
jgi:hypothetical protein